MYVDKRLAGIQAVQTLSRLNRIHPLKEDTFVLDFVNDPGEIQEAFKQFYEGAVLGEEAEPEQLYQLRSELMLLVSIYRKKSNGSVPFISNPNSGKAPRTIER